MKKQKKQNLLTIIIILLVIALATLVGSMAYEEVINMNKHKETEQTTIIDNKENEDEEEQQPSINEGENSSEDEEFVGEEEKEAQVETEKSDDEKAIDLAKKEWGNDETVTFNVEEKKGTKYYVAVKRDASTVAWYEVDTESWEISEF